MGRDGHLQRTLSLSHADVSYLYGKQILQSKIQVLTITLKKFGIREKGKEMKRILYSKGDPIYPSFLSLHLYTLSFSDFLGKGIKE